MCKAISDIRSDARATALAESKVEDIIRIMKNLGVALEKALDILEIPADQRDSYREMVEAAQK